MSLKAPTATTPDTGRTYTPEDLRNWSFGGTALAVLGHPISHSLSPAMHNAALLAMSRTQPTFSDWKYFRFDVPPEALADTLPVFADKGFHGLNLTIPHKIDAVSLVHQVDPDARAMGAVNTLKRLGNGWCGFNSDGFGLETAVQRSLQCPLRDADVILLGAGGAARAAATQCLLSGCRTLWIGNRSRGRLDKLIDLLQGIDGGGRVHAFTLPEPPPALPAEGVVINATSLGLSTEDPAPMRLDALGAGWKIHDMTYGTRNNLCREAATRGMAYTDGLPMLVWQGVRSLEIWSGLRPPAQIMMRAACLAKGFPIQHV